MNAHLTFMVLLTLGLVSSMSLSGWLTATDRRSQATARSLFAAALATGMILLQHRNGFSHLDVWAWLILLWPALAMLGHGRAEKSQDDKERLPEVEACSRSREIESGAKTRFSSVAWMMRRGSWRSMRDVPGWGKKEGVDLHQVPAAFYALALALSTMVVLITLLMTRQY